MINDPNGLLFYAGVYHLFHQYNQHEVVHWGHAISDDLVHWRHLPPAIFPDHNGQIYSGTAIIDLHDVAGLQTGPHPTFLAFFTFADHSDGTQSQGMAFSTDCGATWTMHPGNPIVPNPGVRDFRDPKVLRHDPSGSWVMVIAAGNHVEFFRSHDLTNWTMAGSFGAGEGAHGGVWECPDIFELPVNDQSAQWVLSISVADGAPAGGSGMQYFIGDFDGFTFTNANPPDLVLWQNWGKDYYAGITWEHIPASDGRRLMIAWADNWTYRFDLPTTPFNGQLTIVRELTLRETAAGLRLRANPASEVEQLREQPTDWGHAVIPDDGVPPVELGRSYEVVAVFDTARTAAAEFGFEVRLGDKEVTRVGYDRVRKVAFIDRTRSGFTPHTAFPGRHEAPYDLPDEKLKFRVFVDRSSVEVFVDDGIQLTDLILPSRESTGFRPYALAGQAHILELTTYRLTPIWSDRDPETMQVLSGTWASTNDGAIGSSSDHGLALLDIDAGGNREFQVTILGTREGNPTKILGQAAAGLVLYDQSEANGVRLTLEHDRQRVTIARLSDEDTEVSAPFPVEVNVAYTLSMRSTVQGVELVVDGVALIGIGDTPDLFGRAGLYVRDAEACFAWGTSGHGNSD
jgi:fructan beta-fructosidase